MSHHEAPAEPTMRQDPPPAGAELDMLVAFLEFHRQTLRWKTQSLTREQLNTSLPPSTMTLGGMLKHLALVEDIWFSQCLHAAAPHPYWSDVDWDADFDWGWHSAAEDSPEELFQLWEDAMVRSRRHVDQALQNGGLDQLAAKASSSGTRVSLRWILLHMIEEYARHVGHADLIRESIDGLTGE
ncbi:DinB family protein [Nesterenkonia sp.]|uniref:DinB family protein n=1 Tax=Nesterenkonia sp. TaxID=704201 RepID=UPI00261654EE|nr:DinB family protein [Nesterenkonia sp.]